MSEKQKTLEFDLDDQPVTITVSRSTARTGVLRYQLMTAGNEANQTETDEALKPLRFITYPDCIAGTATATGFTAWPISFEEFSGLPETLVDDWVNAVYEINPHWRAAYQQANEEEPAQKKEPGSKKRSNGS